MPAPRLSCLSTQLSGGGALIGALDLELVTSLAKTSTTIVIVSAFYDVGFLRLLAKAVPKERRVKVTFEVFVHQAAGRRLRVQLKELRSALAQWRRVFRKAEVHLVSSGALFHSKMLLFHRPKDAVVLLGSANATRAAFTENEEMMLRLDGPVPSQISAYLTQIRTVAHPIAKVAEPRIATLVAFYRSGTMFYRPNVVASFRFDLGLPKEMLKRFANTPRLIPGISARASNSYNPFVGIGQAEDADFALDLEGDEPKGGGKVSLRPYGVQTCYGWWVPSVYAAKVRASVDKASAGRMEVMERIAGALNGVAILDEAAKRFADLVTFAEEEGVDLPEAAGARTQRFKSFIERARTRMKQQVWMDRASKSYLEANVPEVWADPLSAEEFSDSFFGDLEYVAAGSSKPFLWKALTKQIPALLDGDDSSAIRRKLAARLKKGWLDADWIAAGKDSDTDL